VTRFRRKEYSWLFEKLIDLLAERHLLKVAVIEGLNERHVGFLLRASREVVAARFGFTISIEKPFHNRSVLSKRELVDVLSDHLENNTSSVVIGLTDHWSVVERITSKGFRLVDSSTYYKLRFNEVTVTTGQKLITSKRERITPSSIHLLSCRCNGR
jgi:hypothetical protein